MKKAILILAVILTACNQEESIYDKRIRENNEKIAKSQAKLDSIDLELLKLGVYNEPGR